MSRMQNSKNEVKNNSTVFASNNGKRLPFGRSFYVFLALQAIVDEERNYPRTKGIIGAKTYRRLPFQNILNSLNGFCSLR